MKNIDEVLSGVDWEQGLVSPEIHFDEDVYRAESDKVFNKAWLVVGHEDMVPKINDYVTNYMGDVPVVVTRDGRGDVHVLVNRCSHRGNQVCLFDRGNAKGFTCSYHGWSFGLDGQLNGVPMEQALYHGKLDKSALGLETVPKVANFHGLLFASFDPDAPSLESWLGEDVSWWLKNFVLAAPLGGLEMLPGWHRYRSPGNWKLVSENFIGDDYHVFSATHISWLAVMQEFVSKGMDAPMATYPANAQSVYEGAIGGAENAPFGMGMVTVGSDDLFQRDLSEAKTLGTDAVEWIHHRKQRLDEISKDLEGAPYSFMNGGLFPNLGLMGFFSPMIGRQFLMFHPRGAIEHEVWQWNMVEREAPQVVKDLAIQRAHQGQHMAGIVAPDDVENFERMVEAGKPTRNWERPFHYGLQMGQEDEGPAGLHGTMGPNPSEFNQRRFYRFWLQMMERK
ncbi:aromatic ring-hydroxylating oxygenase subunit alpha [Nocardioides massiliensis]|uniref:Phenylpropionate dioxygenase-like ring-hydroxylating dioxygenase large terminal subunit n=1 Tax=Nocardioides massiliensis TaxID=1325935 RepID=A0ABT9NUF9_9ACTN|nr:aromatic ring-hydroxylating dioxygenase subunit alpha [Nocardioides massiliensis]MDP9823635.1 phenylpropionate dioxygenase-like ring-hydroxylating dioxygenase large terminal subunit [Nocardioides massiliensis]